jgi:hypothetical protein
MGQAFRRKDRHNVKMERSTTGKWCAECWLVDNSRKWCETEVRFATVEDCEEADDRGAGTGHKEQPRGEE